MKELTKQEKIAMIDYAIERLRCSIKLKFICPIFEEYINKYICAFDKNEYSCRFANVMPEFIELSNQKNMWEEYFDVFKANHNKEKIEFLNELKQIINEKTI